MPENFMKDASGVYRDYVYHKVIARDTDTETPYYGDHNANAVGKMEIALDLVTIVRIMEDESLSAIVALNSEVPRGIADTLRDFLTQQDLWEDANELYDRLCSWRRLRFERHSS